ncbi:MAG: two-component sensor histidine kinase, partial [Hyphomicrobium sp.]
AQHALAVIAKLLNSNQTRDDESDHVALLDLNAIVARTVSTLQPLAEQRGLTLLFEPEDAHPTVTASATSIRQILLNLLTNALKFTPPGGDVRVVTGYLPNGSVFLVVRDTGDGIEETALARAFSDQPEQQKARSGGGYGIGLPLVRYLIQDMGAVIEFDSAPAKGTVALVSFPRFRDQPMGRTASVTNDAKH